MADETSTDAVLSTEETSLLEQYDALPEKQTSEEQSESEDKPSEPEVKGMDSKFMTKTNQKLADERKLNAFVLRGQTPQEIMEEAPELVERLKRLPEYSDIFTIEDGESDEDKTKKLIEETVDSKALDNQKRQALSSINLDGKPLSNADINLLRENKTFSNRFNALVAAGEDPYQVANDEFMRAYPKYAEKVGRSILSERSESTPYTEEKPKLTAKEEKLYKGLGVKPDGTKK